MQLLFLNAAAVAVLLCMAVAERADSQAPPPGPFGTWSLVDPLSSADPASQYLSSLEVTSSGANNSPIFSNDFVNQTTHWATNGWNHKDAKLTFGTEAITMNASGQGQRIPRSVLLNSDGMGDAIGDYLYTFHRGGVNAGGDEGQVVSSLQMHQADSLSLATIKKVIQATINTTSSQAIVKTSGAQAVSVASAAGLAVGQWVIVEPQTYDGQNQEAVQVTAVGTNSITGRFTRNHAAGVPVIGAVELVLSSCAGMGQGRLLVNLSPPSCSTGTASIAGSNSTQVNGVGTSWTTGLTGATPINQGAITFAIDNVTLPPSQQTLRDWYGVISVTDDKTLHLLHRSQVGITGYTGLATAPTGYMLAPAAIVMALSPTNSHYQTSVVLSANSFTWIVGDSVECTISPEIDATGLAMRIGFYSTGGTYRGGVGIYNDGLQPLYAGFSITGDPAASYLSGIRLRSCRRGIMIADPLDQAITFNGANSHLQWGDPGAPGIYATPHGIEVAYIGGGHKPGVIEQGKETVIVDGDGGNSALATWGGSRRQVPPTSGANEVRYELVNRAGDVLTIIGDASNRGFDFSVTPVGGVSTPMMSITKNGVKILKAAP